MRTARLLLAASCLAFGGIVVWASGCGTAFDDCTKNGLCGAYKPGGSNGSNGTGGAVMPACMDRGDPTTDPTLISDECGLFVRGDAMDDDNATGVGTQEVPYKTIQAAVNVVTNKWIFICGKNAFSGPVTISKDQVLLYG